MSTKSQIKNDSIEAIVNEWPDSQFCIGCKHAIFVPEGHGDSAYACQMNSIAATSDCDATRQEASDEEWHAKFEPYNPFYQKPTSYHPQATSRLDDNISYFKVTCIYAEKPFPSINDHINSTKPPKNDIEQGNRLRGRLMLAGAYSNVIGEPVVELLPDYDGVEVPDENKADKIRNDRLEQIITELNGLGERATWDDETFHRHNELQQEASDLQEENWKRLGDLCQNTADSNQCDECVEASGTGLPLINCGSCDFNGQ